MFRSSLDELIMKGGLSKNRTTRDDRALHYHNQVMLEIMITVELAKKFGVTIPHTLCAKLRKLVIFFKGFFHHRYMDK